MNSVKIDGITYIITKEISDLIKLCKDNYIDFILDVDMDGKLIIKNSSTNAKLDLISIRAIIRAGKLNW